ncbi:hypothetical protein FVE85_3139 [Porphyridium purpureum]|uniref:Uncharacterized protein n=1 Tax=Porphyridium purpureum TaxID=35688 RepID=A0A5J4YUM4_PORPP|nr:hypothetical protein FVE85_3139 [Porphyridium purpureum]|eukprot:POR6988..scf227_4
MAFVPACELRGTWRGLPHAAVGLRAAPARVMCTRTRSVVTMMAVAPDAGEEGRASPGRASEFDVVVVPGDKRVQDQLADAVSWEAEKLNYVDHLDFFVRSEMHKFRERLHEENKLSARKFKIKSDYLALLETCVHTSRWNQEQMVMDKEARERRAQIQSELAVIDALLRREQMRTEMRSRQLRTRHGRGGGARADRSRSGQVQRLGATAKPMRSLSSLELASVVVLSAAATLVGQHELAHFVEEWGPSRFESWSFYTFGLTVAWAYLTAVSDYKEGL